MKPPFSHRILLDLDEAVELAARENRVINLPIVAENIRRKNEVDNIALEDVLAELMRRATCAQIVMMFDGR